MLSERQINILNEVIQLHTNWAKPIASSFLHKRGGFKISPATLRNEMLDLEDGGYLTHLHTSGGKVPTDKAYRLYVNNLLSKNDLVLDNDFKRIINTMVLGNIFDSNSLNREIAKTISCLTNSLVITNRFGDRSFYKSGLASILSMPEFEEIAKARDMAQLTEGFEALFDEIENQFFGGTSKYISFTPSVFIGSENPNKNIKEHSVICGHYRLPDLSTATLTLIGPKRMDYGKNISLIKYTTDLLNKIST
ncbi:MAG: Transcriptional regulator of heat shock protein [Candidatus Yanofskybacteria bacterium GW2011_GWF1_44_227]|uniref:Heat-inducible transcription repressor HrcA n=1 Tax=Candidatus Yanofskybacteria bacterium GW2011_GWE2_40_11 TaxID=1619033 RepID=A0A0G0TTN8_9BACT|nr:MAG: Transcriptional regulator of heat shock protein [Candidatus Yanofskybacteria bacterium GW2011_GWE1_40_10]KKR41252.1 MAG: Transcriptional regulator of heat shock protein [Candidatus Yanofskybacteria bacterium GW2011_GWE2_40_11]KKT52676.1 MAG: Transcriptional regulator of heat shock protein [Candidatus Yanofskybacteria bacterium GW2011_GWF1_44_227]OGN36152.1 MAG: hypothetical protein A2241_00170 [Candidatus Yanofskybacteria bacterium RIFOXYA2_FULL_45_28]OGN36869.1 MAG: hypothetical protei